MSNAAFLRQMPLFQDLDDEQLNAIFMVLQRKDAPKGTVLFDEGGRRTGCFVVIHGSVSLYKNMSEGNEMWLADVGRGGLVGHISLLDGSPRAMTARVEKVDRAMVLELPHTAFDMFMSKSGNPTLAFKLLNRMTEAAASLLRAVRKRAADLDPVRVKEIQDEQEK